MEEEIRQIKKQLRMAMNGIVSSSMREKGVDYRINFGLTAPLIKRIAASHAKQAALAEYLWKESIRESKILATLLYPENEFSEMKADEWLSALEQPEIADQLCYNLLGKMPYATALAFRYTTADTEVKRYAGFQLLIRALLNGQKLTELQIGQLIEEASAAALSNDGTYLRATALNCLKTAMRKHPASAKQIVEKAKTALDNLPENPQKENVLEDLRSELYFLEEPIF